MVKEGESRMQPKVSVVTRWSRSRLWWGLVVAIALGAVVVAIVTLWRLGKRESESISPPAAEKRFIVLTHQPQTVNTPAREQQAFAYMMQGAVTKCPACHDEGFVRSYSLCPTCLGGGMISEWVVVGAVGGILVRQPSSPRTCPTCGGLGFIYTMDKCETCGRVTPSSAWIARMREWARQMWWAATGGKYVIHGW